MLPTTGQFGRTVVYAPGIDTSMTIDQAQALRPSYRIISLNRILPLGPKLRQAYLPSTVDIDELAGASVDRWTFGHRVHALQSTTLPAGCDHYLQDRTDTSAYDFYGCSGRSFLPWPTRWLSSTVNTIRLSGLRLLAPNLPTPATPDRRLRIILATCRPSTGWAGSKLLGQKRAYRYFARTNRQHSDELGWLP